LYLHFLVFASHSARDIVLECCILPLEFLNDLAGEVYSVFVGET